MTNLPLQGLQIARVSTTPFLVLTQLLPQLKAINEAGGQVTLISSNVELSLELSQVESCLFVPITIERKISFYADIIALFKLWKFFRSQRFDIVHSITPKAGFLCAVAGWLARVPVRLHTFTGQPWVTMRGFKKAIVIFCDKIISILNTKCYVDSFSQRDFLIKNKMISLKKISVLGSGSLAGIDTSKFNLDRFSEEQKQEIRDSLGLKNDTFVFLFVGRIMEDKGVYELLKAMQALLTEIQNIVLLIVGPFEDGFEEKIRLMAEKLCGDKVIFVGLSLMPERFMAIADLLCLPSYREGFGTVVLEAAAMGLPTVGTRIYGLTDAVIEGKTGLLVEPKNVSQLLSAMRLLMKDVGLRKRLGENARIRAISEFEGKKHGEIIVKDYRDLLKC